MAQVTLPYTLTAGTPENVSQLMSNLKALAAGVNAVDSSQLGSDSVTTAKILNGAVTTAKIDTTVAGQLGLTTRGSVSAAGEQQTSTGSSTYVEVVGVTTSVAETGPGVTYLYCKYELKSNNAAGKTEVRLMAGSTPLTVGITPAPPEVNAYDAPTYGSVTGTTYGTRATLVQVPVITTGSVTYKLQYRCVNWDAFIRNVTLSYWTVAI